MPATLLADDLASRSQSLGQSIISSLSRWYDKGVFYQYPMTAWFLNTLGPACLMSTLAKYATNPALAATYTQMVVETVNRVIAQNVNSSGLFTAGLLGAGEGPDQESQMLGGSAFTDTAAIEATASIGWILYQLPDAGVPAGAKAKWLSVCQANCDQMDSAATHDTTYYINGNFNVHLLNAYWLTAMASSGTQQAKYQDCYERALAFIQNPVASGWPAGYGLIIDVTGVAFDWSDYQAHLVETNAGAGYPTANPSPNFDPYYSTLQLDLLARLFLVSRDFRIGRLLNAITNKIDTLMNPTTWVIDCTGGSRHSQLQGYYMSYHAVNALIGCKALDTTLLSQTNVVSMWDTATSPNLLTNSTNGLYAPGLMRQLALTIATVREAASAAHIRVPAT